MLWEGQERGWLTHRAYERIGRVDGALARYADRVFDGLNEDDQEAARRVFVQLVRPGEGTEDTRRVATRADVGAMNWPLTALLADKRLVVTGSEPVTGEATVEVIHEALIQRWQRLRGWMASDRAFRAWQEGLRIAVRQWQESEQDPRNVAARCAVGDCRKLASRARRTVGRGRTRVHRHKLQAARSAGG